MNPVPLIDFLAPPTLVVGSSSSKFTVYGKNFVSGSVVEWNGASLPTVVVGGSSGNGDSPLIVTVPGNLLASSGTATITVSNPSPGGGTSGAASINISTAHPVVYYPSSIGFGTVLADVTETQTIYLENVGSANYMVSSLATGNTALSAQESNCNNVGFVYPSNECTIQVSFLPTTAGTVNTTLSITDNTAGSPHIIPVTAVVTQTLTPIVNLLSINALGQPISATLNGTDSIGGPNVPAVAWIEYGTDPTLSTFSKSDQWTFTGDAAPLSGTLNGLSPATTYAARFAVQTAGGTGKFNIQQFATIAAWPEVNLSLAAGASNVATISAGQTATYQLVISDGGNGYVGTASLSCTGAPAGGTCSVTPGSPSVGLNGTTLTITVTTTGSTSAAMELARGSLFAFGLLLAWMGTIPSKKRRRLGLVLCLAAMMLCVGSCGGGGAASSGPPPVTPTPSGSYYLQVSASAATAQTSYLLTLNVN